MRDRIEINVSGRKASLFKTIDLPTGNDGSIEVHFSFDDETVVWSSAIKIAFCAAITATGLKIMLPAVISTYNVAELPKEVLDIKAAKVYVGVNGTMPDGIHEATEMVYIGKTTFGANIDEPFFQPGQIESDTFDKFLSDLATMLKENQNMQTSSLPCVYFDENHHLVFQLGGGIVDARIKDKKLEVCLE